MRKSFSKIKVITAVFIAVAMMLVATGCTTSVKKNNVLTIGAEQQPDCLDFVGSCSGSAWGYWMVAVQTLPRAFSAEKIDGKEGYESKITNLLAKDPILETDPVQKMTYEINPDAVWSDGVEITGQDFVYTWDQIANTEDVYDKTGYDVIKSVDVDKKDNKKVVVTMGDTYAGWKTLFGGNYGILPSHILKGKDRNALTKDGYTFSGGPFKLAENGWKKGDSISLVPNDKYWGDKPKVDKVVFKFLEDTVAQFKSFKAGEVDAIQPQPQLDVIESINNNKDKKFSKLVDPNTGAIEALWINNSAKPFDSIKVRQALGYSIDRDSLVKALFGDIGVTKAVNSLLPPILSQYANPVGFSDYKLNTDKASSLLAQDGWKKNSDGIYAKNGKLLEFTLNTTEGNERRVLMIQNIQSQLQQAGWKVNIEPLSADVLFGDEILPEGKYQAAIFAQVITVLDPPNCSLFCIDQIPGAEDTSGTNTTFTNNKEADKLLKLVDRELDEAKRIQASSDSEKILAEIATSFPLDPLPDILLWNNKKIGGDIQQNPVQGPFWTLYKWTLK